MRIAVAGMGYVGLANAVLLAQNNKVTAVDISEEKVNLLNNGISPVADEDIERFLRRGGLSLSASADAQKAYREAQLVIIAVPTDYDHGKNYFDTSAVESVIEQVLAVNGGADIVIRSTVPVGFTDSARKRYGCQRLIFAPEFLREGRALYDCLYPSRIIAGAPQNCPAATEAAKRLAELLKQGAACGDIPTLFTEPAEAEAVKLFSNTYLALRVAYFNELDTYCEIKGLNARQIIDGVCLDPRIGAHYNNPSFGYGGYCLPKDAKQLLANYRGVPSDIIGAVVSANRTRKDFIAHQIAQKNPRIVGIYRLAMKSGADNFRHSSVLGIIRRLMQMHISMIVYEPLLCGSEYFRGCKVYTDLDSFKRSADIIVSNRISKELADVADKVYTRDIYGRD